MTTKKRLAVMLLAFVLGISAVITAAQVPVIAKAESKVTYTNVLEDLQRDSSFSKDIEKFGRNDFVQIDTVGDKMKLLGYILKYLEKSGERIVYSKGLPQFFISDIMDDDVVCPIGMEDQKLLLFDDFLCWDEGCLMGQVSPEVIAQMRTAN